MVAFTPARDYTSAKGCDANCPMFQTADGSIVQVGVGAPFPTRDHALAVSAGDIPGHTPILIEAVNDDLAASTEEDVWDQSSDLAYLASAETMNIVATSTDDDGAPVGSGALTVKVSGLDGSHLAVEETVTMNGTTNVLTTQAFLRVNTMSVVTAGSGGTNAGVITATASSAGAVQSHMPAGISDCWDGFYSVPADHQLCIIQAEFNAIKVGGGAQPIVTVRVYTRNSGDANPVWRVLLEHHMDTAVGDHLILTPAVYWEAVAKGDLRVTANSDTINAAIHIRLTGILIDTS